MVLFTCQTVYLLGKALLPLFPSHKDELYEMVSLKLIWNGILGLKVPGFRSNSRLKCDLPLMCLPKHLPPQPESNLLSADSSFKVSVSLTVALIQNLVPTNSKPNIYKK